MGTFRFDRNGNICPFKTISFDRLRGTSGKFYSLRPREGQLLARQ